MSHMDRSTDETHRIDIEKLGVLNHLGTLGAESVESRLGKLAGTSTAVESGVVKNGYVDESTIGLAFAAEPRLGVRVQLKGAPYGCILVLFTPQSATRAVAMMLADTDADVDDVSNEMAVSSIVELGGIVANGFLDALADTFDEHIATGAPIQLNNQLPTLVENSLTGEDDRGLYLETALHIASHDVDVELCLFPENGTFARILDQIDMETVVGGSDR